MISPPIAPSKDFCFCTLALGKKYRILAKQLAENLSTYSAKTKLVVLSDRPQDFQNCQNVLAFEHHQQGILYCFNDKRFVLEKALEYFEAAIHIDADTRIISTVSPDLHWQPGITAGHQENLVEHVQKYTPERLSLLNRVADKLGIAIANVTYIGESLYIVARDNGKEKEFFKEWGRIAHFLEMNRIHSGDGNLMGLAAAKVGWTVAKEGWEQLNQVRQHLDASYQEEELSSVEKMRRRFGYHYRLNRARLMALRNVSFFYF
jgi:hypothetical protein